MIPFLVGFGVGGGLYFWLYPLTLQWLFSVEAGRPDHWGGSLVLGLLTGLFSAYRWKRETENSIIREAEVQRAKDYLEQNGEDKR